VSTVRPGSRRTLTLLIAVAALAPNLALGQLPLPTRDRSQKFLAQLSYVKAEYPYRTSSTCIAVFPDGHFHLENRWTETITVGSGQQIFEGALSQQDIQSLSAILAEEGLTKLAANDQLRLGMSAGEIIRAVVPRAKETQDLFLVGIEGAPGRPAKPLPAEVAPVVQWIRGTRKEIEKQKDFFLNGAHSTDCWLPQGPLSNVASGPAVPTHGENTTGEGKDETVIFENTSKPAQNSAPEIITDQTKLYAGAKPFVDFSEAELRKAIPGLHGLNPAQSQDELPNLLSKIGDKTVTIVDKMPNLISHEDVVQKAPGLASKRQRFDYLIVFQRGRDFVTMQEYRVDVTTGLPIQNHAESEDAVATASRNPALSDLPIRGDQLKARATGDPPLSQGFANMWVYFYPLNRSESAFRYLGRQSMDHHNTFVIVFAQKPSRVRMAGRLLFRGHYIPLLYQGVAWIDQADFRIVRLRADLLAPIAAAQLQRLTADVHFEDTPVSGTNPLWLPREVTVTSESQGQTFEERHLYSGYRLYGTESKMVIGH
jgi:hypothetical protein